MRHYGLRRRGRAKRAFKSSITHVPSTMDQSFAANILALVFSTVATVTAGTNATNTRLDTDRDREVSSGENVGFTKYTLQFEPNATAFGTIEYVVFKVPRSFIVPVVGTDPIPSSVDVDGTGIQQAFRINMPGWVYKFGVFPVSAETPFTKTVTINWNKFKVGTVRDGDHFGIALFNRATSSVNFSVQMFYKSYR